MCVCHARGVDDQALGITVNLGASGKQTGVGDTEVEQGGLDRPGHTVRPGTVVRFCDMH